MKLQNRNSTTNALSNRPKGAVIFWLFLAGVSVLIAAFRAYSAFTNGLLGESTGNELIGIFNLRWVAGGEPIYTDPFSYPYRFTGFNWLFYRFYGFVAGGRAGTGAVAVARLTTLAFATAGVALTTAFLRLAPSMKGASGRSAGFPSALAFSVFIWLGPEVSWWAMTARPDMAALFLEFCGLVTIMWNVKHQSSRKFSSAAFLFFLAWSFKQTFVGIYVGVTLALLARRSGKFLMIHILFFLLPVAISFIILQYVYGTDYWNNLLFVITSPGYSASSIVPAFVTFLRSGGWMLACAPLLALIAGSAGLKIRIQGGSVGYYISVVFFACLVIAIAAAGHDTGDRNYFFSSWIVGMTGVFLLQQHVAERLPTSSAEMRLTRAGLGVVGGAFALQVYMLLFSSIGTMSLPSAEPRPAIASEINRTAGPVLVESDTLSLELAYKPSRLAPRVYYGLYDVAVQDGLVKDGGLARRIDERYFESMWLLASDSRWKGRAERAGYRWCDSTSGTLRYSRAEC